MSGIRYQLEQNVPVIDFAMYELHQNEQYFFDQPTLDRLSAFLSGFVHPCCLCTPVLGQALIKNGVAATILDIDQRFAALPGFRHYDLYRPHWLGDEFDIIVCDPPFFKASLSQLFTAIRLLSRNDYSQPLLMSYLRRREGNILGTFAPFKLRPTGYCPSYQTVQRVERNEVEFFTNLDDEQVEKLKTARQGKRRK